MDFHELWRSVMSVSSLKLSSNGLGDCPSSTPAMGCVRVEISSRRQTCLNSSALLVSLMACATRACRPKVFSA